MSSRSAAPATRHAIRRGEPLPQELELISSSAALGWKEISVQRYREPVAIEHWVAPPRHDLTLILFSRGGMALEQRRFHGSWQQYPVAEGDLIMRPPGCEPYELRWWASASEPVETVHLQVRAELLERIAVEIGIDPRRLELPECVFSCAGMFHSHRA